MINGYPSNFDIVTGIGTGTDDKSKSLSNFCMQGRNKLKDNIHVNVVDKHNIIDKILRNSVSDFLLSTKTIMAMRARKPVIKTKVNVAAP